MYGGNVRISQLLALLIVIVAAAWIIVRRINGSASVRYLDPIPHPGETKSAASESTGGLTKENAGEDTTNTDGGEKE
ncbi:hypothetical protein D3C81_2177170 [compost metagenome]